jgi:NADPH-dependent curcumin reductase CurA
MPKTNRQIQLAARPKGLPKVSDFQLVETPVKDPGAGELLIRTVFLSVDPYMRGRMNERRSYADPVAIGEVMVGEAVGVVEQSNNNRYKPGDVVGGMFGWQEYAISDGRGLRRVDPSIAPISTALGVLGMPGMTAYFGLLEIGQPISALKNGTGSGPSALQSANRAAREVPVPFFGETVVVSGAAGAVGSAVGQIAKIKGCRVVGIAGSDEKIDHITKDLGFDAGFNYKSSDNYVVKLKELCPGGIDVYYDNVGGPVTDAVFPLINVGARIVVCGQIAGYNSTQAEQGPRFLWKLIEKRARVQGFLVFDFAPRYKEALAELSQWVRDGKLKYREHVVTGIENAPEAFLGLFKGENIGKQLVKVSEG